MRLTQGDYPVRCSVCLQPPVAFNPKPEYVNFEAGYDGPVVSDPETGLEHVYIENIVVCEDCVRQAAGLLGFEKVDRLREHVAAMEAHMDQQDAEIARKDRVIADLEHTVGTLIDNPVKRPAGRPQLRGPETHDTVMKEMRSARSKAEKAAKAQRKFDSN